MKDGFNTEKGFLIYIWEWLWVFDWDHCRYEFKSSKVTEYFCSDLDRPIRFHTNIKGYPCIQILIGRSGSKQKYYVTSEDMNCANVAFEIKRRIRSLPMHQWTNCMWSTKEKKSWRSLSCHYYKWVPHAQFISFDKSVWLGPFFVRKIKLNQIFFKGLIIFF